MQYVTNDTGVVVIGRNEGERLKVCLCSVKRQCDLVVYVDSGSADGSVEFARSIDVEVVELDLTVPFTMARGRNAGIDRLCQLAPNAHFVQFIDGDCELVEGWMARARITLDSDKQIAAVCGRRRERYPQASIYNQLADMEWDGEPGVVRYCGGDALMRIAPLIDVGKYDPHLIAGEEPDLCYRLRHAGLRIVRIDAEMTLHDAAMTKFSQWWKRAVRGGHAYADGLIMHRRDSERFRLREVRSAMLWGCVLPLVTLGCLTAAIVNLWIALGTGVIVLMYGLMWMRIWCRSMRQGYPRKPAALYASACIFGKCPQVLGIATCVGNRMRGRRTALIEYKGPTVKEEVA